MEKVNAKPFLKWVGGKSQLISQMEDFFPEDFIGNNIKEYFEPFVGGGAVFFYIFKKYGKHLEKAYLYDINEELILAYNIVQKKLKELLEILEEMEYKYYSKSQEERKMMFYEIRSDFNTKKSQINFKKYKSDSVNRVSQLIFLNKTCFNGLFRVNNKGGFNAPFGSYKKPKICNKKNLTNASKALQIAEIKLGDFKLLCKDVKNPSFIYYDPPYKPVTTTANFVSYTKPSFNDDDQKRLARIYKKLHEKGAFQLLSNSDPSSYNPENRFFEELYKDFKLNRVYANRMINCDSTKRGKVSELLITNY